jgi:hypothetical protein
MATKYANSSSFEFCITQEEGKEGACIIAEVRVTVSSCVYHFVAHTALLHQTTRDSISNTQFTPLTRT